MGVKAWRREIAPGKGEKKERRGGREWEGGDGHISWFGWGGGSTCELRKGCVLGGLYAGAHLWSGHRDPRPSKLCQIAGAWTEHSRLWRDLRARPIRPQWSPWRTDEWWPRGFFISRSYQRPRTFVITLDSSWGRRGVSHNCDYIS